MPLFTATRLQVITYLLGVCPFSIAFLVFLNSSVSFVITDLIGRQQHVGNAVGNLGFADELVALVACPFWGLLSDRIGVRTVCVIGYAIICLALIVFVQAKNIYPQLLLARLFFSVGGAAASTMVTAVLPTMSYVDQPQRPAAVSRVISENRHTHAPSIASELTITPARFQSSSRSPMADSTSTQNNDAVEQIASTSKVAGFVGMFTGLGALLALFLLLPLPASFQHRGVDPGQSLQFSYYIVAAVALILSILCFFGLNSLKSESQKGWSFLLKGRTLSEDKIQLRQMLHETSRSFYQALLAGFKRTDISIGYLGGFVARASSVGISLFIPLLVNALFLSSGLCKAPSDADTPGGLPDIKRKCPRAYTLAAELTGIAETIALVSAPIFGYWSAKTSRKSVPLAVASLAGVVGYPLFAATFDPDDSKKAERAVAFVAVCLIGFSQIGAIVCSLASLSIGVLVDTRSLHQADSTRSRHSANPTSEQTEAEPLLDKKPASPSLSELKGSVAGVYSLYGGAAILLLTKAGGALFDSVSTGVPFYIMAAFNGILLVACIVVGVKQYRDTRTS